MRLAGSRSILAEHAQLGDYRLFFEAKPVTRRRSFARMKPTTPASSAARRRRACSRTASTTTWSADGTTRSIRAMPHQGRPALPGPDSTGQIDRSAPASGQGISQGNPTGLRSREFPEQETAPDEVDPTAPIVNVGVAFDPAGVLSGSPAAPPAAAEGATTFIRNPFGDFDELFERRIGRPTNSTRNCNRPSATRTNG